MTEPVWSPDSFTELISVSSLFLHCHEQKPQKFPEIYGTIWIPKASSVPASDAKSTACPLEARGPLFFELEVPPDLPECQLLSLGATVWGKWRYHLPRNSRNSSTPWVSAAAAPALCLGAGTSHSLSAGHRTGEKMTRLEGWEELGRFCSQHLTLHRSPFMISIIGPALGSRDAPATPQAGQHWPHFT